MVNGLSCDLEVWSKALFKELVRLRRYVRKKGICVDLEGK